MLIPAIAVLIGLGYFFYPPRFPWVKGAAKYLVGVFCFWIALVFSKPEVHEAISRPAGFFLLLLAGLLLLADLLTAMFRWIFEKLAVPFRKTPELFQYLNEIWAAFEKLAARKVGALIIIEQKQPLRPYVQGGMPFDAEIRSETLIPLFLTTSPVHDGAFVVRKGRIQSVKGILPLATLSEPLTNLGTRHRAAIGITEKTDAIALAVSEEHGHVSLAYRGCLVKINNGDEFSHVMNWVLKNKNIFKLKNAEFIVTAKVLDDWA